MEDEKRGPRQLDSKAEKVGGREKVELTSRSRQPLSQSQASFYPRPSTPPDQPSSQRALWSSRRGREQEWASRLGRCG